MVPLDDVRSFALAALDGAGALALDLFRQRQSYTFKTDIDDVLTPADLQLNRMLEARIRERFPQHGIRSEESAQLHAQDGAPEWIIDPLDGSRNFALGISYWCIMLALAERGQVVFGAVHDPFTRRTFHATRGQGAYDNARRIERAAPPPTLRKSLGIAVADPGGAEFPRYHRFVQNFLVQSGWLHNHGSMLSAVHVAEGGITFLLNNYGYLHDYAAPSILCEEAGLLVTDSTGAPWREGRRDIVIAPSHLHADLLAMMAPRD